MKKYLLILSIFISAVSMAQKLQYVNTYGYEYNRFAARTLLGLPTDTFTVDAGINNIPWMANKLGTIYNWNIVTHVWDVLAGGGGSTIYVNAPLTKDVDTINIAEASTLNDGYLSAGNFIKFDSIRNDWYRSGNRLYPASTNDTIVLGVPTTTLHQLNVPGNMHLGGKVFYLLNRTLMDFTGQNAFVGGRSGNTTYSGAVENAGFGELALGGITSGDNNAALGKGAGFTITTGSNWIVIGRNVHGSGGAGTGTNNVAIGANVADPAASDQLNFNNWMYGLSGRLGIGAITSAFTPGATLDIDSAVGYPHLRLRGMAADPTTVNDGNFWHTGNHFYARLNGTTRQLDQQGIDDVLAVGQSLSTNRTLNIGANVLTIGGTGQVQVTTSTSGTPALQVINQPSTTNTVEPVAIFRRNTTGTAATNIAGSIDYLIQNSTGSSITGAQYIWRLTTATAGAEVSNVVVKGLNGGASVDLLTMQPAYTLNNNGADTLASRAYARSLISGGSPALTQYRLAVGDASNLLSTGAAITGSRALVSDANGVPTHATTTTTELNYVAGVTSAIQTQLDAKQVHTTASPALTSTNASGTGLVENSFWAVVDNDFTMSNVATAQTAFPTSMDVWTLTGNTTYYFEGAYHITTGGTSCTTGMGFALGTATLTSINYSAMGFNAVAVSAATAQGTVWFNAITPTAITASSGATGKNIVFSGIMRVNAGGTITPQVIFSADPTGTILMKKDSYIKFTAIGSGTFASQGPVN